MSLSSIQSGRQFERPGADIRKTGFLKKLKSHRPQTLKKKFFVLRSTSASGPARLEYYDSEKKFKSGSPPKRSIQLHTCFNINRRSDPSVYGGPSSGGGGKHGRHGIVLYLSDESFTVVAESEEELDTWLTMLLDYQNEFLPDGDMQREHYEFVWQVTLQARGLGKGTKGTYRLCLNDSTVCLVRLGSLVPQFAIPLVTIRSVAFSECIFRMEVGKYAPTGEGEFSLAVEDSSTAKDMHNTILHYMNSVKNPTSYKESHRRSSECHTSPGHRRPASTLQQRPASYCPPSGQSWASLDPSSPSSPGCQVEFSMSAHRARCDTGDSHRSSHFDDHGQDFSMGFNGGDQIDAKEQQVSLVPADMSPPSSPTHLDVEVEAYLEMDMSKQRQSSSSIGSGVSTPPSASTSMTSSFHSHKGEMSTPTEAYIAMVPQHAPTPPAAHHPPAHVPTAPIPIHTHSYSDPHHPTPLPTVREGGSNEGYVPMDSSSPASSYGSVVRPGPAKCMLSDDSTGMHPRTYSLGSKPPVKKYAGYVEMGPGGAAGKGPNDMPRATSVPHIILKGRRERDSPSASASPLSMSLKSDDSADSFMEYMPMRPRTASDSFNYNRPRTASFGNKAATGANSSCRPRSSSHGQGTRPFLGGRLGREVIKQEPVQSLLLRGDHHRVSSQTSSPHGSFDSLRVSNESLRRLSLSEGKPGNLSRQQSGSNASDYSDARGTPSPKTLRSEPDGYVNMQPGNMVSGVAPLSGMITSSSSSSSHRIRTDSASSRRSDSNKMNSSERLHNQNKGDYAEMAPLKSSGSIGSATGGSTSGKEAYVSMDFRARHSFSSDTRPNMHHVSSSSSHPRQQSPSNQTAYINMDIPGARGPSDQQARSVSMENVDNYVVYDPAHPKGSGSGSSSGGKPRTGSLGSKDKKGGGGGPSPRPGSGRKPSSNSMSSVGSGPYGGHSASASTRTGGSNDSLRSKSSNTSRQSSMEKYGSLGKDFRKKSASMGSRPVSKSGAASGSKSLSFSTRGDGSNMHPREYYLQQQQQQQLVHAGNLIPIRKTQRQLQEEAADEYIEFSPNLILQGADQHSQALAPATSARGMQPSSSSSSFTVSRSPINVPALPGSNENDSGYTMYNPALPPELVAATMPSSAGFSRMAPAAPHPVPQTSFIHSQHPLPPSSLSRQSHPHQHHHHSQGQSPSSPSPKGLTPTSSHPSTKDESEYVGYKPSHVPTVHAAEPPSSTPVKTAKPALEINTESEYVGYEPAGVPSAGSTSRPAGAPSPGAPHSDYVGYDPCRPSPVPPPKPLSPGAAVSYIQGGTSSSKISSIPGQPKSGSTIPATMQPLALSPRQKTGSQTPPSHSASPSPRPAPPGRADDSEYMGYNPAVPAAQAVAAPTPADKKPVSERKSSSSEDSCNLKENVMPTPARAVSYIQSSSNSGTGGPSSLAGLVSPLKIDVGAGERNSRASSTPPLSNNENSSDKNGKSGGNAQPRGKTEKQDRMRQQGASSDQSSPQQQQLHVNLHRAMSSPSGTAAEFPSPVAQGARQLESPSPSGSGPLSTRHKHFSGSSNSSQKSGRRVSSSNDSLRGDKKSDSSSSLNSSTSSLKGSGRRGGGARDEGGDRLAGNSLDRSPLSPALSSSSRNNSGEFFCGEVSPLTSQQLEAKIVPVESRIRHSVGDVTTQAGAGGGSRESTGHQGLVRPGSTPCVNNLGSTPGGLASPSMSNSGSAGQQFSAAAPCCDSGDPSSANSRTRLSLSDVNSYQQKQQQQFSATAAGSQGLSPGVDMPNPGGLSPQPAKPLNYVKLDLSGSTDPQAGGDNNARAKSRHSSDVDEKEPPLSYAEIDFVKSQNLSKCLAMNSGSGDEPSKS